jgi:hypothetical protein
MFTMMSRRTVAAALAIASVAACVPGVASAAKHTSARAGSHTAATKTMTQSRHVVTGPLGGVHGTIGGTTVSELQGGSTGDGKLGEEACERLGELADQAFTRGDLATIDGNQPQANNSYEYANALVDYGMDNGCFFVY